MSEVIVRYYFKGNQQSKYVAYPSISLENLTYLKIILFILLSPPINSSIKTSVLLEKEEKEKKDKGP